MKKSRFTEEQIVFALRQADRLHQYRRSVAGWVSPVLHSVRGARNTAGFPYLN